MHMYAIFALQFKFLTLLSPLSLHTVSVLKSPPENPHVENSNFSEIVLFVTQFKHA